MNRLLKYSAVGFDIDLTLGRYQLRNLVNLVYGQLADYLINHRGYPERLRRLDWSPMECGIMSRAAMLDKLAGNLLLMSPTGSALRVCHGTKQLDARVAYPPDGRPAFADDALTSGYRHEREGRYRFQDTHYDLPGSLIFAKLVDMAEESRSEPLADCSALWRDCYSALIHVYSDGGSYFKAVLANPGNYLCPVTSGVRDLLSQLRRSGVYVFLLSSSEAQFGARHLEYILGADWPDLFDCCLLEANKPNFFFNSASTRHFERLPFGRGKAYIGGSAAEFERRFLHPRLSESEKPTGRTIAYFGDSVRSDLVTAVTEAGWDVWMVTEELSRLSGSSLASVPGMSERLIVPNSTGCRPASDAWLAGLRCEEAGDNQSIDDFVVKGQVTLWAKMLASRATAVMSCLEDLLQ